MDRGAAMSSGAAEAAGLYEGGINVPLIISGAGVANPGREAFDLVNLTDLFATILETAGSSEPVCIPPMGYVLPNPVSLVPIINDTACGSHRDYVVSDHFRMWGGTFAINGQAIRNDRDGCIDGFKLIHFPNHSGNEIEFYDLQTDPFEGTDLYIDAAPVLDDEQQCNFNELCDEIEALRGEEVCVQVAPPGGCP